jgi:hypothetical protein
VNITLSNAASPDAPRDRAFGRVIVNFVVRRFTCRARTRGVVPHPTGRRAVIVVSPGRTAK